ncbi:MAG: DinB family protein [Planctomycetaceae bacterium]
MTTAPLPDIDTAMAMLQGAVGQIQFARRYTLELLDATPREHWFTIPDGLPTNIAWQVGHLAVSQYGLLMFRVRGRLPEDLDLIPSAFRKAYSRQTTPNADPAAQPTADELLNRLNGVHDLALAELEQVEPAVLLEPVEMPYAAFPIKLGAILFCPLHEQIHAGQIGLLRRALKLEPVR